MYEVIASWLINATNIEARTDLDRWKRRKLKWTLDLLISYLISFSICCAVYMIIVALQSSPPSGWIEEMIMVGLCVGGLITIMTSGLLYIVGINRYDSAMYRLKKQKRVCEVCESVSLFDDFYINPSDVREHSVDDLVPKMIVIEEDEKSHVVCHECYEEINQQAD